MSRGVGEGGWAPPPPPRSQEAPVLWKLQKGVAGGGTDPADGEEQPRAVGADAGEAEAQLPVEEVLPDEGDEAEGHGGRQHVEHARHVVDVQLAAHHLVLLVVADPREPQGL